MSKGPASEDSWTGNMVNGWKHYFSQKKSALTIFTDLPEGN